jgi:predicted signal transduction protein with EAL and GGDEF domain
MTTDPTFIATLVNQVPSAAAVIVVVMLFLRSLEKRDQLFYEQMAKLTEQVNAMEKSLIAHDTKMDEGIAAMHRAVKPRAKNRKAS